MNRFLLQIRFIALALLLSTASTVVAQMASSPQSLDDVIYNPAIKDGKARHAIGEYQMKQAKILSEDRNLNVMTLRNTEVIVYDWFAENANVKDLYKFSFGNSNALLPNNSMQNRRLNRRLEIYLVPGQLMIDQAKKNLLK